MRDAAHRLASGNGHTDLSEGARSVNVLVVCCRIGSDSEGLEKVVPSNGRVHIHMR